MISGGSASQVFTAQASGLYSNKQKSLINVSLQYGVIETHPHASNGIQILLMSALCPPRTRPQNQHPTASWILQYEILERCTATKIHQLLALMQLDETESLCYYTAFEQTSRAVGVDVRTQMHH